MSLDVSTRWNSNYIMLKTACYYEKSFEIYEETESSFLSDLGEDIPDFVDWEHVSCLVKMLKIFYDATVRISELKYVTANYFLSEISNLSFLLDEMQSSSDISIMHMGMNMKHKFHKYWGEPEKINYIIFMVTILDPRYKIEFLKFSIDQMYGEDLGNNLLTNLKFDLSALFDYYVSMYGASYASKSITCQSR